jgi:thiol-disulfide isomerase/thioredoxin
MNVVRTATLALSLATTLALATASVATLPQDGGKPADEAPMQDGSKEGPSDRKSPSKPSKAERDAAKAKAKWFEKLDREDKAAVEAAVGFAAPALPEDIEVLGIALEKMADLRGKVVVLQTFSSKSSSGMNALRRAAEAAEKSKVPSQDVVVLGIHTPDGLANAKATLEKQKVTTPVLLDATGAMCDALGAFRKPIAYVVDRQGNLRYGGLTPQGISGALAECAAEAYDPEVPSKTREEAKPVDTTVKFPTYTTPVQSATDLRGQRAPQYAVERWYNVNSEPKLDGKLIVIDFWATWCGPCIAAIPHMNEIAQAYPQDVVCLGVSDESWGRFEEGTLKKNLRKSGFKYPVGIDSQARMKNAFGVRAIPHAAIVSSDGIVRWQGHPMSITPEVMNELVAANRSALGLGTGDAGRSGTANRWQHSQKK